jgi:hypothetical protein
MFNVLICRSHTVLAVGSVEENLGKSGHSFFCSILLVLNRHLSLVMHKGGILATFDAGIAALAAPGSGCLRSIYVLT